MDDGKLPGLITMVARHGKIVHFNVCGMADVKREVRLAPDTIFRFYSMTKPLTSTAIMMLYEEGRFQLDDPIARFLPCFKDMRVSVGGMRGKLETVPAERDITFRDLLTHTSGPDLRLHGGDAGRCAVPRSRRGFPDLRQDAGGGRRDRRRTFR